ncbi:MAG: hypothetical protein IKM22_03715 [Clostridia bacterium]|nr:hypothetical protein [Clostridia bacterium]
MKKWLLYFFAVIIILTATPFVSSKLVGRKETEVEVNINGKTVLMNLDEYVARVLLGEGQACESAESKKALAVAVRSCCMNLLSFGGRHMDFDFCDRFDCCFALGDIGNCNEETLEKTISAVNETKGIFLTYKNMPALSLFTLCSGSSGAFFELAEELTPIKEDHVCEIHKTEKTISYENILKDRENAVLVYDENNDCSFAVWDGKYIKGTELKEKLSLPSTEFTLEFRDDGIFATAYGLGNGFGMSLCHAETMAKNGKTYTEILEFYYPNFVACAPNQKQVFD